MNIVKTILDTMKKNGMLIALIGVIVLFQVLLAATGRGSLLNPANVSNIISQNSYVVILATGMLLCILTGGNIDLSVGAIVCVIGAIAGTLIVEMGVNIYVGMAVCLVAGVAIGAWQGFWIAYVGIPPFITTLAGFLYWRGFAHLILNGLTISPFPDNYLKYFTSFLPSSKEVLLSPEEAAFVKMVTIAVGAIICLLFVAYLIFDRKTKTKKGYDVDSWMTIGAKIAIICGGVMYASWLLANHKGIPVVLILLAVIVLSYSYFTTKMVPGRHFYALGGNEKATRLSGIDTKKIMFFAYTNMGFLSAVAGLVVAGRFNSANPAAGNLYELDAIGACFIGGASAYGGTGTVGGAVIGAMFMGVLNNGMSYLGLDANWQKTVKGLVVLAAVVFDVISKKDKKVT
ncbi:MAG: sugar ABC transporter permease [Spirochaetes bacterium]|nr:sugar ABC transporter permease [Spirochaetota bacterium]MBN2769077.1 sugar ABC transporter permease [Spirochaetota bacterium]